MPNRRVSAQIFIHKTFDGDPMWSDWADHDYVAETHEFTNVDLRQDDNRVSIKAYPPQRVYDVEHDPAHLALINIAVPQVTVDHWGRPRFRGFTTDWRAYEDGVVPVEGEPCTWCDGTESAGHLWAPYLPPKLSKYLLQPVTVLLTCMEDHV